MSYNNKSFYSTDPSSASASRGNGLPRKPSKHLIFDEPCRTPSPYDRPPGRLEDKNPKGGFFSRLHSGSRPDSRQGFSTDLVRGPQKKVKTEQISRDFQRDPSESSDEDGFLDSKYAAPKGSFSALLKPVGVAHGTSTRAPYMGFSRKPVADSATGDVIIARCDKKLKVSVLSESVEKNLRGKLELLAESDSDGAQCDELVPEGFHPYRNGVDFYSATSTFVTPPAMVKTAKRKKRDKVGLCLPSLTTEAEEELLSEIFRDWHNEVDGGEMKNKTAKLKPVEVEKITTEDSLQVHFTSGAIQTNDRQNLNTYQNNTSAEKAKLSDGAASENTCPKDYLNLESVLNALPDNGFWQVSRQDLMRRDGCFLQRREGRTRNNVCILCGETSYGRHVCVGALCDLCHSSGHCKDRCPFKLTVTLLACSRCGCNGHLDIICPEVWRQYHNTVSGSGALKKNPLQKKPSSCFNCSKSGHYAHACRRRPKDRSVLSIPSPVVFKYDKRSNVISQTSRSDQFNDHVINNMTEEDSDLMSATSEHKIRSQKRLRPASAGTPRSERKMRWRNRKETKNNSAALL